MTQGEQFIAVAENEEKVFISGKEEGYVEGYAEGYNAAKKEAEGYTVELTLDASQTHRDLHVSKTELNAENPEISVTNDAKTENLTGVTRLYFWTNNGDFIYISKDGVLLESGMGNTRTIDITENCSITAHADV